MSVPRLPRLVVSALLAAVLVAGCGGSDTQIPAGVAQALVREIDSIESRVSAGECRQAKSSMQQLGRTAGELPEDVDTDVRTTLAGGIDRLGRLVRAECKQKPKPTPKPEPVEEAPEPEYVPPAVDTAPEPAPEPAPEVEPQPQEEPKQQDPAPEEEPANEQPKQEPNQSGQPTEEPKSDGDGGSDVCPPGDSATC